MTASRKKRHSKKQRVRAICIKMSIVLFALIITACGLALWKKDTNSKPQAKKQASEKNSGNLTVETTPKPENETKSGTDESSENASDETEPAPKDIRTVKNTATEEHHKTNGLSICMYHYVYDESNPPAELNSNYIEVHALEEELQYLVDNEYFFPTWEEVREYIDGKLLLPEKSVVLTFDDGAKSFLNLGVPLFNKYKIPVTSFLITSNEGPEKVEKYAGDYLTFQSHSDNMHRAGGNIGHGGIFPALSYDEAVADLNRSIDICGHGEAFAYPYGDYTDECVKAVEGAGFLCAVTTEYERVYPGDNPLLLPRIRMLEGQSLDSFKGLVE